MRHLSLIYVISILFSTAAFADKNDHSHPKKISKDQIAGQFFTDHKPIIQEHEGEIGSYQTQDIENFLSTDKKFDSGMYRSGPVRMSIDHYGVDEFMYFVEGGVTLTSEDGTVTEIGPGDAVTIGRDWKGVWDSKGYMKIYVIYSANEPLE